MKKKLAELREERAAKITEMRSIHDKAANENRDLSSEENTRFEALKGEERSIGSQIERAESLAEMERRADASPIDPARDREVRSEYSLAKAIQESMSGRLTGIEAEEHAELSRNRSETRGVMVPTSILLEHRAVTTSTPGTGPGSNLVGRTQAALTEHPRPTLLIEGLGATVMRDLTGNIDLPRLSESGSVGWVAEHADVGRTDPKFSKSSMSPKTVGGEYEISRRMILQSSTAIEALMRRDLGVLLRQALDGAAVAGAGGVAPTGILNTAGIVTIPAEAVLSDTTAEMIAALELDDLTGSRAFVSNPNVAKIVRKLKDADGRTIPMAEQFHGERTAWTNQIPANIGDTSDKNALIYGQWSELIIGYWSGVDILVNPYHADVASKGGVLIHAFLDADVVVREPKAFVVSEIA
ncbi:phage major capsid protein [Fulvimarina sp. MAC3]|uniref:phage major capsid protein n=1 Tax=Fulvimarina sp. MAC3 TaxID=3148887 RepID=UPI0031FC171F